MVVKGWLQQGSGWLACCFETEWVIIIIIIIDGLLWRKLYNILYIYTTLRLDLQFEILHSIKKDDKLYIIQN